MRGLGLNLPEDDGVDILRLHAQVSELVDQPTPWPDRIAARPVIVQDEGCV